jgi:hypothetical protein
MMSARMRMWAALLGQELAASHAFRPCRGASITQRGNVISSFSGPILVEAHR